MNVNLFVVSSLDARVGGRAHFVVVNINFVFDNEKLSRMGERRGDHQHVVGCCGQLFL